VEFNDEESWLLYSQKEWIWLAFSYSK
jgi:hypothetical protein